MGGRRGAVALAVLLPIVAPLYAPQLLAFPYQTATPIGTVWSERPIAPAALAQAARIVQARMATTPLAGPDERRPIFLTDGGWRWLWLAPGSRSAFGLSRPLTKAVIVNRTAPAGVTVRNGQAIGGSRTLAGVLAHEFTHGLIRRRFGVVAAARFPRWKTEGYCDVVAGETSLSAADVAALQRSRTDHPALVYYHGRQRVAADLARSGGDVAALFAAD